MSTPPNYPPNQQPGQFGGPAGHPYPPPGNLPPGQQPYGAPGPYAGQQFGGYPKPPKKGMSGGTITLLVLLGVFVLFVGGCVAAVAASGFALSNTATEFIEDLEENRQLILASATITECGVDSSGTPEATVALISPFEDSKSFITVEVEFLVDSAVVGEGSASFDDVEPNQSVTGQAIDLTVDELTEVECVVSGGSAF